MIRFGQSEDGAGQSYVVTADGAKAMVEMAAVCLEQKKREYENLLAEVTNMNKTAQPKRANHTKRPMQHTIQSQRGGRK